MFMFMKAEKLLLSNTHTRYTNSNMHLVKMQQSGFMEML